MRLRPARVRAAVALMAGAAALGGCGSQSDQIRGKVEQFVHAVSAHDYRTLCKEVLAPSLLARLESYGLPCERAMAIALSGVHNPGLAIGAVQVHGDHASVDTITTAKGQEASLDAIQLIDTRAGWRVAALGAPVLPGRTHARSQRQH
jgi:hypothetical protein